MRQAGDLGVSALREHFAFGLRSVGISYSNADTDSIQHRLKGADKMRVRCAGAKRADAARASKEG